MANEQPTKKDLKDFMWRKGDLEWKLWPQQVPIYQSIRKLPAGCESVVILCARQFGKSHLGVILALEDCLRFSNRCILIMGPTIKQAIEIVAPRIREISRDAPEGLIRRSKSEGKWYIGDSELVIGGFDQSSSSQRGKTVQTIYIEEIVDSNPDQYTDSMKSDLGPALTHSKGGKMIFLTTPPKLPSHPFVIETIPQAKLHGAFYNFTIHDNKQLSRDQYDACVRRCGGTDSTEFRREYLCHIIRDAGMVVVPEFSRQKHCQSFVVPDRLRYQIAIDWGGIRDFTACLLISYDFMSDVDLVLDEMIFKSNVPTSEIIEHLQEWHREYEIEEVFADVPGQLQVDLQRDYQYPITLPHKFDWQSSINQLCVRFATGKILIRPDCEFLIQTLESAMFNKTRTDFERNQILGHCDALAALMYGVRALNRNNPWPEISESQVLRRNLMNPMAHYELSDTEQVSELVVPKAFGQGRIKFGRFK